MVNGIMPTSLQEALEILSAGGWTPYAGGTDLMPHGKADASYLFLNHIPELRSITVERETLRVGAAVTFSEAMRHPDIPPVLREALSHVAAPAIRNRATFGGNLANGSPKADTLVVEAAMDAKLRLVSLRGERLVSAEAFQLGEGKTVLAPDELIAEILLPRTEYTHWVYEKIGGRLALAISRVTLAGVYQESAGRIRTMAVAFGAVAGRVLRCREAEEMLLGKTREEAIALRRDFLQGCEDRLVLQSGRVSAEYRRRVCENLLSEFYTQCLGGREK